MCRYNVIWPSQGFTCVNVCLLNRLDFFLKYKSWLDLFSVCVCVFLGSMCLKLLLRDDFERFISCLDHWLCCMFMFFSSRKTVFKKIARHLLGTWLSVELPSFFSYHNLDTSSTPGGLIKKVPASSIASRQLVDRSSFYSCI